MLLTCLLLFASNAAPPPPPPPPTYTCAVATAPVIVDGTLGREEWAAAAWTNDFVHILGADKPAPPLRTRTKFLWDDRCLYVAAEIHETDIRADMRKHDDPLWRENAFELFLDPDGDGQNYMEFEINARGTTFDLLMSRPYKQKGRARTAWSIEGLKSAVKIDGTLNDPSDQDRSWTIELSIPWTALEELAPEQIPPKPGSRMRMNLARMQYERGEPAVQAWTWAPHGEVNMHMPSKWGYLVLSSSK